MKLQLKVAWEVFRSSSSGGGAGGTRDTWAWWPTAPRSPVRGGYSQPGKIGLQESEVRQDQLKWVKQIKQDRVSQSKLCAARRGWHFFLPRCRIAQSSLKTRAKATAAVSHWCSKDTWEWLSSMSRPGPGTPALFFSICPFPRHLSPCKLTQADIQPGTTAAAVNLSCKFPSQIFISVLLACISLLFLLFPSVFLAWTELFAFTLFPSLLCPYPVHVSVTAKFHGA